MFDATVPQQVKFKSSVPMECEHGSKKMSCFRPKATLVGKSNNKGWSQFLACLDNGRLLLGYGGMYVSSDRGLQLRDRLSFEVLKEVAGPDHPFCLHPDQKCILGAGMTNGCHTFTYLIDSQEFAILDRVPICPPFGWLSKNHEVIIGAAPQGFGEGIFDTPSELLEDYSNLRDIGNSGQPLMKVDLKKKKATRLTSEKLGPDGWTRPHHLALSQDRKTLFYATATTIGAIEMKSGKIEWKQHLGTSDDNSVFSIYALALSPDGRALAAGGISSRDNDKNNFVILDAKTGEFVFRAPLSRNNSTSISQILWHPSGWMAVGTAKGIVMHVDLKGNVRSYKAAPKGIRSLTFLPEQKALLVGSGEKHLRLWPLLEDELGLT